MKHALMALAAYVLASLASSALADAYTDGWGLAVGAKAPTIKALDQTGAVRDLSSLAGERGLLLFLNRSADW